MDQRRLPGFDPPEDVARLTAGTAGAHIPGMVIKFEVLGTPAPKGSSRAFMSRGPVPNAILAPSGSKQNQAALKSWDRSVRECATEAVAVATQGNMTAPPFVDVPLRISIQFRLSRPAGHYGKKGIKPKAPPWPSKKPDLDKLLRSTKDSLKGIVYDDDSRIVRVDAEKIYAAVGNEGATIVVERASSFT